MYAELSRIVAQIDIKSNELNIPKSTPDSDAVSNALSIMFGVLGAVCFLIIVVAGMRYSLSRGNAESVSKSKNTIIYAAVGLVVAMMAWAIVRFVVRGVS